MLSEIRVLIVCSGNGEKISSYIQEQADSLIKKGIVVDFFLIYGKGVSGYMKNYMRLLKKIKCFNPNLVHAHYGFSGMLAVLQRKIPVIITFHGSDINEGGKNLIISRFAERIAAYSIFVNKTLSHKLKPSKQYKVISCGVNLKENFYIDLIEARTKLGYDLKKKLVLFSSGFNVKVKNYPLAKKAISLLENVELIEMKGYKREEVTLLMNACNALLVTSCSESGPLVVKEALACGCPVVSTDVGDVKEVIGDTFGCAIAPYNETKIAEKLEEILKNNRRVDGKDRIIHLGLEMEQVASQIIDVYNTILSVRHEHFRKQNTTK